MTDEQINRAIAEYCGEIPQYHVLVDGQYRMHDTKENCEKWIKFMEGRWERGSQNRGYRLVAVHKQYCRDLNAMHEAKKTMTSAQCSEYNNLIVELREAHSKDKPQSLRWSWGQPARIEAEAFLRTVGKWEDGK